MALVVGCSLQSADPENEPAQNPGKTKPDQEIATAAEPTPAILQHVQSLPIFQQTPIESPATEPGSEIVQTRYRPPSADLSGAADNKPPEQIEFGRAPDYGWLQGELLFSSVRGVWRMRYAAADDDDAYGGSVTLVGIDSRLALHAGQRVRIKGRLINPRSNEPSPFYRVLSVQAVGIVNSR
jgi:hypothetical protein